MVRSWIAIGAVFSCAIIAAPLCAEEPMPKAKPPAAPRYKLRVGQELKYSGTSEFVYDTGTFVTRSQTTLLVVRQNADFGARLLIRQATAHGERKGPEAEGSFSPDVVTLAWCDVSPQGRIADNPTLGFNLDIRFLLPQLPTDGATSWNTENHITGMRHEYSIAETAEQTPDILAINDVTGSFLDEVYQHKNEGLFEFDLRRGLVVRAEFNDEREHGFIGKGTSETKLGSAEQRDPNLATFVAVEMADYFAVKQEYDELVERAAKDTAQADELLERAKGLLDDFLAVVNSDVIRQQVDADLTKHPAIVQEAKDSALRFSGVLGQPSPAWETKDLEGTDRSIAGCRGKVVILDFWYRGCGWCIRAMPQVKEVAAHFQGRPVEVFGMNTDTVEEDARFVIEKMALTYPTLKADGLAEKYHIRGFPTLVIIDQAGVVRNVEVGYSPTLAKKVVATVEKLLASPPAEK